MTASDDKRHARAELTDATRNLAVLREALATTADAALRPRILRSIAEHVERIKHLNLAASEAYHSVHTRRYEGSQRQQRGRHGYR
jgi:hypothetical protein